MDGAATASDLKIVPIAPAIGAEIHGVDLAAELPDETVAAIRRALPRGPLMPASPPR